MQNQKKDYKYLYLKYKNKYINAKKLQVGSKVDIEKPLLIRQETKPIIKINETKNDFSKVEKVFRKINSELKMDLDVEFKKKLLSVLKGKNFFNLLNSDELLIKIQNDPKFKEASNKISEITNKEGFESFSLMILKFINNNLEEEGLEGFDKIFIKFNEIRDNNDNLSELEVLNLIENNIPNWMKTENVLEALGELKVIEQKGGSNRRRFNKMMENSLYFLIRIVMYLLCIFNYRFLDDVSNMLLPDNTIISGGVIVSLITIILISIIHDRYRRRFLLITGIESDVKNLLSNRSILIPTGLLYIFIYYNLPSLFIYYFNL